MNYFYTYLTTNISRKERNEVPYLYVGQHCTHNMCDNYKGSCRKLNKQIKEGDIYEVLILKHFIDIFELGDAEYDEIRDRNAIKDEAYYNKYNAHSYNYAFMYGISDKVRGKISKSLKGTKQTPESNLKRREKQLGKIQVGIKWSDEKKLAASIKQKEYLRLHPRTEETKRLISESCKRTKNKNKI